MATPTTGVRVPAGFMTVEGGMNSGISPQLIAKNQLALAGNVSLRGGYLSSRPALVSLPLTIDPAASSTWSGIFQGASRYDNGIDKQGWIVSRGGRLFFVTDDWLSTEISPVVWEVTTVDFTVPLLGVSVDIGVVDESAFKIGDTVIIDSGSYTITVVSSQLIKATYGGGGINPTVPAGATISDSSGPMSIVHVNPPDYPFVYIFQAEEYAIILAGQNRTIIFDGTTCRLAGVNEVPCGFIGVYGWGRIWIFSPNRRDFWAGDLVRSITGQTKDILSSLENTYLNGGGAFSVPANAGPITSAQFLATQDTSLGIGVLLVGTTNMVFSVNAPVDRTQWQNLTYPIQTVSLLDYGPVSARSTVSVNGDMWYRSNDGFRSFIVARRNFPQPGNTPQSREITKIIQNDEPSLLNFGSGVFFDNRLFQTVSPFRTSDGNVCHRGLALINFDLISNLQGNSSPAWEGVWTGFNILQVLKGTIDGRERAFIFADGTSDIEMWEISTNTQDVYDTWKDPDPVNGQVQTLIESYAETRAEDYGMPLELKKLVFAAIWVDDIVDTVECVVSYKPDQYPTWIPWQTFTVCAQNVSQCVMQDAQACTVWKPFVRLYAPRITLGQPPDDCGGGMIIPQPLRLGHTFQFRLEWYGHWQFIKFETRVQVASQNYEGSCPGVIPCASLQDCGESLFTYTALDHVPSGGFLKLVGGGYVKLIGGGKIKLN